MTANIHYMFLIASHMGFFSFVFGIVVRCVVGPLPFVGVFLLVQTLIISAYLAIGFLVAEQLYKHCCVSVFCFLFSVCSQFLKYVNGIPTMAWLVPGC